jgi:hypothetical protein
VTGLISLGHAVFTTNGHLPSSASFIIGVALLIDRGIGPELVHIEVK